jgi:hypothetical protein
MSDICVHTVNKYYLFKVSNPPRYAPVAMLLEDSNVQFQYIKGESIPLSYLLFSERQNPRDSPEISTELVTPDMGNGTFYGFIT